MNGIGTSTNQRLYYIDWLRVLVVLSLIPFHAALTYSGLGDIYISNPLHDARIIPFMLIVSPLSNFFMTLLFFVSGIASFYSIRSRGLKRFALERCNKLLIPFIIGTITLCPVQAYFKALYEGYTGNYFEFFPHFFSNMSYYMGYAHLWFLLYLYVFSLLSLRLIARWDKRPLILSGIASFISKGNRILIPMSFIVIIEALLRPLFTGNYTILGDWANDIVYFSFFLFGYIFAFSDEIRKKLSRYFIVSFIGTVVCTVVLVYTFWMGAIEGRRDQSLTYLWATARGIYECASIVFLLGVGERYLNRNSAILQYLTKASFTYYIFHFVPVICFTYLVIRLNLNVYVKFLLAVIPSYFFVIIIYEVFGRRLMSIIRERH